MTYAVGSLVSARGREWVVLPESDDDLVVVRPLGGSDAEITGLLTAVEEVKPATFDLPDATKPGDYRAARMLRDALRLGFRSSAGPFRSLGHLGVEPRPYQLVPLLMALRLDPVRLLIADDVGIGKTIESALIAREMLDAGDARRLAVLCPPHLAEQWQGELAAKFHIDATLVLPSTVTRLERNLGVGQSIFDAHPHVVVSTDFIKSDRRREDFQRTCPELVIVDEAHTCASAGANQRGRHQRHELVRGLAADANRHLILVTATPHSGKEEAFRSLLGLLDQSFDALPDDLSGDHNRRHRERLARHLVQRRRADIRRYIDTDTAFPERLDVEQTYELSPEYRALFDKVLDYARETVRSAEGGAHRQRVRYWSALALLSAMASSPAAAAATLRTRARVASTESAAEADEVGRQTVLDLGEEEDPEGLDVVPGADDTDDADESARRRLRALAREADGLAGALDHKLTQATALLKRLVADGAKPIVFCRYLATAAYLAEHLRGSVGKGVEVAAVTGALPPAEREARILELAEHERHVLVATDCLSEGINLQEHFDAVFHYDLPWNPTRLEQREGRVDRFNQQTPEVRVVTYYGADNQIDDIVLDVLLRKHRQIRKQLGVSIPVPGNTNDVIEAVTENLLLAQDESIVSQRLPGMTEFLRPTTEQLHLEWERAAEHEQASRSLFAQASIQPDEVAGEVAAMRAAVGSGVDVESFVRTSVSAHGGIAVRDHVAGPIRIDLDGTPQALRDLAGAVSMQARFDLPVAERETYLSRTHPFVSGLARYVIDAALDGAVDSPARRCGLLRTSAVSTRATLLVVRYRFHLVTVRRGEEEPLVAEDAAIVAFEGDPTQPRWLDAPSAESLVHAAPSGNVSVPEATEFVSEVLAAAETWRPHLDDEAEARAAVLHDAHERVREAARQRGVRYRVTPQLPADVLGVYIFLPSKKQSA
jgi:superfamily II DNA or RNA helicase